MTTKKKLTDDELAEVLEKFKEKTGATDEEMQAALDLLVEQLDRPQQDEEEAES